MQQWNWLEETKWKIIESLSQSPKKMKKIAESLNTSVANVSQHLKILDAQGLLQKEKEKTQGQAGKPSTIYKLKTSVSMTALAEPGTSSRRQNLWKDKYQKTLMRVLSVAPPQDVYYLVKLFWEKDGLKEKCDVIAYLASEKDKIELFVLTEQLEKVREKYSNFSMKGENGEEKKIVCWSHNEKEVEEGLKSDDDHYHHLISNSRVLYDPNDKMRRWIY